MTGIQLGALVIALATSVVAGTLASRRVGIVLGAASALIPSVAFLAAALLPIGWFGRWFALIFAIAAVCKGFALARANALSIGTVRGLAYLALYPGLEPSLAFVRDPAARRGPALGQTLVGLLECVACLGLASWARRVGVLDAGTFPAAWARAATLTLYFDGAFRGAMGLVAAAGFATERVFRDPWLLSDLGDFWGRRWNRFIGRTLHVEVFTRLQPKFGRALAVMGAFVASGILHEVLFVLLSGTRPGEYLAFFGLQGVALLVGARLFPGRSRVPWVRVARRAYGWLVLLATAPLFFGTAYQAGLTFDSVIR
ncbi:MAG: hypothetical protein HY292_02130 [Planctomycetes bacterium]|nr:hypothetical protein [Planctomycetota bacterium]